MDINNQQTQQPVSNKEALRSTSWTNNEDQNTQNLIANTKNNEPVTMNQHVYIHTGNLLGKAC